MGNSIACTSKQHDVLDPTLQRGVFDLEVLRNLDIFILDNSIRETTVAQTKGHVLSDKVKIFDAVQGVGITDFIVATYTEVRSVDDEIASMISAQMADDRRNFYCFSECFDTVIDGAPCEDVPLGILKMLRYGVAHVVLECNFFWQPIDRSRFTAADYAAFILRRCQYIRQYVPDATRCRILLNVRDALAPWFTSQTDHAAAQSELLHFFALLARFPAEQRLFGIMTEEPSGLMFPWQMAAAARAITTTFRRHGWSQAQFLLHVHRGFGLAESVVLAALSNGATGVWCGVCEEGAITGHASSLMTLTNLARLGNRRVLERFNLPKLREAAIRVTEITTGAVPHEKHEILGTRAFDVIAQDMDIVVDVDPTALLGIAKETRMSSIATSRMIRDRLNEVFGPHAWDDDVLGNMRRRMYADLLAGKKYEYQSSIGLLNLYERSQGSAFLDDMLRVVEEDPSLARLDRHRLLVQLKEFFYEHCDMEVQGAAAGETTATQLLASDDDGDGDGSGDAHTPRSQRSGDGQSPSSSSAAASVASTPRIASQLSVSVPKRHTQRPSLIAASASQWASSSSTFVSSHSQLFARSFTHSHSHEQPPVMPLGATRNVSFAASSLDVDDLAPSGSGRSSRGLALPSLGAAASPIRLDTSPSSTVRASEHLDRLMQLRRVESNASNATDEFDLPVVSPASTTATARDEIQRCSMSYERFNATFLSYWTPNTRCQRFREVIKIFDANQDGFVEWRELELRAKWALAEFSVAAEAWSLEDFIQNIFETFVFIELNQPKKSLKLRSLSFSLHNSKTLKRFEFHFDKHDARPVDSGSGGGGGEGGGHGGGGEVVSADDIAPVLLTCASDESSTAPTSPPVSPAL
eukprot:gene2947-2155_t